MPNEPILIWGAGAIGGTLGAYWARAGIPVLMVDIAAEHVEMCRTRGLHVFALRASDEHSFIVRVLRALEMN